MDTDSRVFTRRVLRGAGVAAAVVTGLLLLWSLSDVFLLAFAGVLLAVFLRTLGDWLSGRTGLGRGWSLAAVALGLACLVGVVVWLLAPRVGGQLDELAEQLPQAAGRLREYVGRYEWGRELADELEGAKWPAFPKQDVFSRVTGRASDALGVLANVLVVLFVGLYVAAEPAVYSEGLVRLFPLEQRTRAREVLGAAGVALRGWLLSMAFSMTVVGVVTTAGLWLLGVPLALTLGLLTAAFVLIPNFGPFVAGVPPVLLALLQSPGLALAVVALYLAIQVLEGYVLTPLVQRKLVSIPPALLIVVQVSLGVLVGGLGLLLAAPLTAVALVLVKTLYVRDQLGDAVGVAGAAGGAGEGGTQS